ncbi:MAG: hypothetical protein C0467_09645 [Planctomycetaceae bacterium]|nr:hypothetical protein [Planctomycetaceae bacterium]
MLFVLFALPGAVAIRVYALWCPTPQKDWKESISDAIIYSFVGLTLWMLIVPEVVKQFLSNVMVQKESVNANEQAINAVFASRANLVLFVLITPAVISSVWYFFRLRLLHRWIGFDHPTRTAWDWVFSRKRPVYILFHLKSKGPDDSQTVRVGYFNGRSYVTSYPLDAEIYVERVHQLDANGQVTQPIPDTNGMLIKLSECERLEFLLDPTPIPLTLRQRAWHRTISASRRVRKGCLDRVKRTPQTVKRYVGVSYNWTIQQLDNQSRRGKTWLTKKAPPGAKVEEATGENPSTTAGLGQ